MRVAVLVPTRGLVFTRVIRSIETLRQSVWEMRDSKLYLSEYLPIPDSHNRLTQEAYGDGATHFFFVEEDVVVPEGVFKKLLYAPADISFVDYGVSGWSCSAKDKEGMVLWAGLGCTMVKRCVFDKLEYPWFRTDKVLRLNDNTWVDVPPGKQYGGQDIWFFSQARKAGCTVAQVKGECDHLKLEALGNPQFNNGLHQIGLKEKIKNYQIIERG